MAESSSVPGGFACRRFCGPGLLRHVGALVISCEKCTPGFVVEGKDIACVNCF